MRFNFQPIILIHQIKKLYCVYLDKGAESQRYSQTQREIEIGRERKRERGERDKEHEKIFIYSIHASSYIHEMKMKEIVNKKRCCSSNIFPQLTWAYHFCYDHVNDHPTALVFS